MKKLEWINGDSESTIVVQQWAVGEKKKKTWLVKLNLWDYLMSEKSHWNHLSDANIQSAKIYGVIRSGKVPFIYHGNGMNCTTKRLRKSRPGFCKWSYDSLAIRPMRNKELKEFATDRELLWIATPEYLRQYRSFCFLADFQGRWASLLTSILLAANH